MNSKVKSKQILGVAFSSRCLINSRLLRENTSIRIAVDIISNRQAYLFIVNLLNEGGLIIMKLSGDNYQGPVTDYKYLFRSRRVLELFF